MSTRLLLVLTAGFSITTVHAALAPDGQPPLVAVFPIEIVDTSGGPANPQWPERVASVTRELARQLAASG